MLIIAKNAENMLLLFTLNLVRITMEQIRNWQTYVPHCMHSLPRTKFWKIVENYARIDE